MEKKTDNIRIGIPPQVEWILGELRAHGYEAFAVGGCVRDALLNRMPEDWDITTSAAPEEVKTVFSRTIDTGLQHGTVTVLRDQVGYEITTYRIDGEYQDGRHPKEVSFTSDLKEDLKRRDFTINAMAYSQETGIVDLFGGRSDLEAGVIRCVGVAEERFTEDALRILRAVRFSAQLNFTIEEKTYKALFSLAPNLVHVSKERIQTELTKTLLSAHPERILLTEETGMAPYICESFASVLEGAFQKTGLVCGDTFKAELKERLERSAALPREKAARWAAFLAEAGEDALFRILKELKMDNDTISRGKILVRFYKEPFPVLSVEETASALAFSGQEEKSGAACLKNPDAGVDVWLRRRMSRMPEDVFDLLLTFWSVLRPEEEAVVSVLKVRTEEIRRRGDCIRLKQLAVTGTDLMRAGVPKGPKLGETLQKLFELVLEHPEWNEKELLLKQVDGE